MFWLLLAIIYICEKRNAVNEFSHIGIKKNGKKRNNSKEIAGNEAANYQRKRRRGMVKTLNSD